MGPSNCAVINCTNNSKKLKKQLQEYCTIHHGTIKETCGCDPPYLLYCFPSVKLNNHRRQEWIKLMRRVKADKSAWTPGGNDRVCSDHFVDGIPTVENPYPSLKLGYEVKETNDNATMIAFFPLTFNPRNLK